MGKRDEELEEDPEDDAGLTFVLDRATQAPPARHDGAPVNGGLVDDVYRFEVGPGERRHRLDLYLHFVFKGRSRNYWKRMIEREAVRVEGRPVKGSSRVGAGDRISVAIDQLGKRGPKASGNSYEVVFEDEALLAVNKRAGAFCHPVGRLHNRSLVNDLRNDRGAAGLELRPCHRLDRFVSGLLLFAKTRDAAGSLGVQFEGRGVEKTYVALVHGLVADDDGVVDLPLGKATNSIIRIKMGVDEHGKSAVTRYRVLERFAAPHRGLEGPDRSSDFTLVRLEPQTGRRHQLRIHLAEIGHPIVNDPLYGEVIDVDYFERQTFDNHDDPEDARRWIALHSSTLTFDHPLTGARTTLSAPPWGEFGELLERLEAAHAEET